MGRVICDYCTTKGPTRKGCRKHTLSTNIFRTSPMSFRPSSSFESTFSHALYVYKKRTRKDLFSQSLAIRLQTCESPSAIISVLQEGVRGSGDESLTILLSQTVNVLVAISASVQEDVGLVIIEACSLGSCPLPFIF